MICTTNHTYHACCVNTEAHPAMRRKEEASESGHELHCIQTRCRCNVSRRTEGEGQKAGALAWTENSRQQHCLWTATSGNMQLVYQSYAGFDAVYFVQEVNNKASGQRALRESYGGVQIYDLDTDVAESALSNVRDEAAVDMFARTAASASSAGGGTVAAVSSCAAGAAKVAICRAKWCAVLRGRKIGRKEEEAERCHSVAEH